MTGRDLRIVKPTDPQDADMPSGCDRRDLARWSDAGGPLPRSLAVHIQRCEPCAEQVRRISQVHACLGLLQTQSTPPNMVPRANGRALRMLRKVTRASETATRLLRMKPGLTRWQRVQIHAARLSLGAAAAMLLLVIRAGTLTGLERTRDTAQALADLHWQRHIDPDGEWFGPRDRA